MTVLEGVLTIHFQNTISPKNSFPPVIARELTDLMTEDVYRAARYTADLLPKSNPDRALPAIPILLEFARIESDLLEIEETGSSCFANEPFNSRMSSRIDVFSDLCLKR